MREIKFRAWNPSLKKFTYFEGINLVESILETGYFLGFKAQNAVYITEYNEPQEFTGFKDSKGKDIYEGDIVHWRMDTFSGKCKAAVEFKNGCWVLEFNQPYTIKIPLSNAVKAEYNPIEIKGNIYENL